ncbi:MAG: AMIN-like domain-containing (lipo)protein [Acidimicrobiales bacterium]
MLWVVRGRPAATVAATVAALALLLVGCAGAGSGSVPIDLVPTTTTPTTSAPSTTTTTTTTTTAASASTNPPRTTAASEELSGFQTDPFRREHPLSVPPVPVLTAIRSAHHDGYDRVVFEFTGPLPGAVSVRYVDRVIADGSGNAVTVAGQAFLQVRFEEAQAHTDAGAPTVANRTRPNLPVLTEVVMAGDYEGYVTVALGLTTRAPFRVLELSNPTRVVVDVRA